MVEPNSYSGHRNRIKLPSTHVFVTPPVLEISHSCDRQCPVRCARSVLPSTLHHKWYHPFPAPPLMHPFSHPYHRCHAIPSRAAGVHVLSCDWPKSGHQPTTTARTRDGSCIYISSGIIITRTATSAKGHTLSLYLCVNFECTQIGRINGRAFHASIQMSIK